MIHSEQTAIIYLSVADLKELIREAVQEVAQGQAQANKQADPNDFMRGLNNIADFLKVSIGKLYRLRNEYPELDAVFIQHQNSVWARRSKLIEVFEKIGHK